VDASKNLPQAPGGSHSAIDTHSFVRKAGRDGVDESPKGSLDYRELLSSFVVGYEAGY
jgi:hypothetical protein